MKLHLILFFLLNKSVVYTAFNAADGKAASIAINNAVVNILQSCVTTGSRTVGLMGAPDELYSAISSEPDFFDIVVVSNPRRGNKVNKSWRSIDKKKRLRKLQYTIIFLDDIPQLDRQLSFLSSLPWWNSAGKFIIVKNPSSRIKRNFLELMLLNTWHPHGIFNVIFLFTDEKNDVILHTPHPYNGKAPHPWEKVYHPQVPIKTAKKKYPFKWTLYERIFHRKITCKSIYFEKALTLNNHVVTAAVQHLPPLMSIDIGISFEKFRTNEYTLDDAKMLARTKVTPDMWNLFKGFDGLVMGTLFTFLNATLDMMVFPKYIHRGILNNGFKTYKRYLPTGGFIILNSWDMLTLFYHDKRSSDFIYPVVQRDITVITNDRGKVYISTQIATLFNTEIITSLLILSVLIVLVLGYCSGQGYGLGALNALSFILGIGIQNIPTGLPARIFLGSLMPYFLITVTTFQSSITQIFTVPLTLPNVDSIDDLEVLDYKVYVGDGIVDNIRSIEDNNFALIKHDFKHCIDTVLMEPESACIDYSVNLKQEIDKYHHKLHRMKEPLAKIYTSYHTLFNWPLRDRFSCLLTRLSESGILYKWLRESENFFDINSSSATEIQESMNNKIMTLEKFRIFLLIWLIGLAISTITFIIELIPFRKIYSINNHHQCNHELDLFRGCQ